MADSAELAFRIRFVDFCILPSFFVSQFELLSKGKIGGLREEEIEFCVCV